MRRRRRRRSRRSFRRFRAAALFLIAALAFFKFDQRVGAAAVDTAEYYCQSVCLNAVNDAVQQTLEQTPELTRELVRIEYSADGYVQNIETDTESVNFLRLRLTDAVSQKMAEIENEEITLRLGSLTGISLLFGRGPGVRMRVIPLTAVRSELHETFEGAGVNQTIHKLSVLLTVDVCVLYGLRSGQVTVESEVVLSQSLVSGQVPGWYTAK